MVAQISPPNARTTKDRLDEVLVKLAGTDGKGESTRVLCQAIFRVGLSQNGDYRNASSIFGRVYVCNSLYIHIYLISSAMIEAGAESTSASLNTCMLYLSGYPEVQRRAQEELDGVVGSSRSPGFSDMDHLPYIRAIVKETLRIRPLTTMGIPHYTTADVKYKGYTIPKDSVVSIQQYPIHYDPSLFPDPETFKPERYLNHPHRAGVYAASADPYDRDHWNFGAGRRICPGMHLAENSLFITVAKILWAFNVVAPGKVDLSHDAFEPGSLSVPRPFSVKFVSRSQGIEDVLKREWEVAGKEGYTLRNTKVNAVGVVVD
jgi:hypothetical protein